MASVGNLENPDEFPGSASQSRVGAGGAGRSRPQLPRPHLVPVHLHRPHPGRPASAVGVAARLLRAGGSAVRPVVDLALHPPLVPESLQPAHLVDRFGEAGAARAQALQHWASLLLDALVPATVEAVLRRLDLTEAVLGHVDLDAVVAGVDLDAAAARLDVDAVVAGVDVDPILDRVDIDGIASRIDINAILDRLNLTELVQHRVDLNTIVAGVDLDPILSRVDVNAIAEKIDIDAILDRLDLTGLVQHRVDLNAVAAQLDIDAILDRLDLTSIVLQRVDLDVLVNAVLDRIDLVGLAEEVIDAVDLPEIIRESTGSMASDTVRGARLQGIHADEAVGRAMDRILLRRSRRHPGAPSEGSGSEEPSGGSDTPRTDGPR